jgi:uncharacterized membrane protein YphA (DoxX/SURF4 family)
MMLQISDILSVLSATAALFIAFLLWASAIHKLRDVDRTQLATSDLLGVLGWPAYTAWGAAVVTELLIGAAVIWNIHASLFAAGLWMIYTAAMIYARAAGRAVADCSCSFGQSAKSEHGYPIARNGLLISLAIVLVFTHQPNLPMAVWASAVAAAASLLLLYAAFDLIAPRFFSLRRFA